MTDSPLARRSVTATVLGGGLCALASLAGCLSVPDGPTPMCVSTSDCDSGNGEVCEEGVCWGNPPAGTFAAVISPPSTRRDLVPRQLPRLALPNDGWMGALLLDRPVLFNGRIMMDCPPPMIGCDTTTIGATITVARRSQFQGGPGYKTVVNIEAGAEFSVPLPAIGATDDPYTVTIVPDGTRAAVGVSAAERVPPMRLQLQLASSTNRLIELGGPDLPVISGKLTDALGQGLNGYRVVALGRWDPTEAATEVSTVDFTDATGAYAVMLSDDLVGTVEIVAQPMPGAIASTIHLANIDATQSSALAVVATPVGLGVAREVAVTVTGVGLGGRISPVPGALVSATGMMPSAASTSFAVADQQVTNEAGEAKLHLLDGAGIAGSYRLSISPPASSTQSAVFDQRLALAPLSVQLGTRIALRGTVVDADGRPLNNVAITARPSLRFLWALDATPQAFVAAIPTATTVTPGTGEFVLWVDANVAQVQGQYDLMIEPPTTTLAPSVIANNAAFTTNPLIDSVDVGTIQLPDAAFVHGQILSADGQPLENAELKLYRVDTQLSLCSEVAHAPSSCPIPAQLQGRSTSDSRGAVRLVLPR